MGINSTPQNKPGFLSWEEVPQFLRHGGMLAYPTDTLWGLGCRADDSNLCGMCLALKGERRQPVASVVVPRSMLASYVVVPEGVDCFFPGPFTLVLPLKDPSLRHLASADGFLGCRIPDRRALLAAVEQLGIPLVSTSLNATGQEPVRTFNDAVHLTQAWGVSVVKEQVSLEGASTVLKWEKSGWSVLRMGIGKIPEWLDLKGTHRIP